MPVANAFVSALLGVLYLVLKFYIYALIIGGVLSWLIVLGVVDPYNRFVRTINDFLQRITEPALRPIRRVVRPVNGLDLSPLILIFIIYFLQIFIERLSVAL
jgi:YggT family protein